MMWLLTKRCLIPVGLAVAPVGAVISLQGLEIFRMFGLDRMLSSLLGTVWTFSLVRRMKKLIRSTLGLRLRGWLRKRTSQLGRPTT